MKLTGDSVADEVYRCIRCGACTAVCPVYAVLGREPAVARGRLRLIREYIDGRQELTPKMRNYLDLCLGCRACVDNCPPGVNTDRIIRSVRNTFNNEKGQPLTRHIMLRSVMNRPERFGRVMRTFGLVRNSGLINRRNASASLKVNLLPPLPRKTFREIMPDINFRQGMKKVGFFLGCMDNNVFPQVVEASVKVLEKHGFTVVIPEKTVCCGIAHINYGDFEEARRLALQNIRAFDGLPVDTILTDCASCGSTLQSYRELFAGQQEEASVAAFSSKVRDINYFLSEKLYPGSCDVNLAVTYHDPCHMSRYQKHGEVPRKIIASIPGVRFVEMKEPDRCCGGGGSFNIFHYRLSMEILRRKIESAGLTGAGVLATTCPACRVQLLHGIRKNNISMEVLHPVELLARSYGNKDI